MKPFVKWVGGKRQLLEKLNLITPLKYKRIVEPFVGGGAYFIDRKPKELLINDINFELITSYEVIKKDPFELMKILDLYSKKHSKDFYLSIRSKSPQNLNNNLEIAARFIYLNKAGFNGIYRVNSKGEFNVPFGYKKSVNLYDEKNILDLSNYLNNPKVKICSQNFIDVFKNAKKGDLFFIDPPYDIENNSFVAYDKNSFGRNEQIQLSEQIKKLDKKNIKFILTNHNTDFIKETYKDFNQIIINANRMINSDSSKRINSTKEIIICNFDFEEETMKKLLFIKFLETMHSTNKRIDKLVNWKNIFENQQEQQYALIQMQNLISKNEDDLKKNINFLFNKDRKAFKVLPILTAIRDSKIEVLDLNDEIIFFDFNNIESATKIEKFIFETELKNLFLNKINNFSDYAIGVEVGLDSNARKNRTGIEYENAIQKLLEKYSIPYQKQFLITNLFDEKNKKVDFFFEISGKKYLLEANFFNSQGSKLSAICGEYKLMDEKIKGKDYEFIWVTDGKGWKSAKKDLEEAYNNLKYLFNYEIFENWLKEKNPTN